MQTRLDYEVAAKRVVVFGPVKGLLESVAAARRDADAARLLIYALQPGNAAARRLEIEGGITEERRAPYRPEQGFEDLELPTEELVTSLT